MALLLLRGSGILPTAEGSCEEARLTRIDMNEQATITSNPIGVVIVSYNTSALLRACLESLQQCTLPLRIVVVDNASPDGSAELVRQAFPSCELICLDRNVGFAAGTNVGLRRLLETDQQPGASVDRVLFLNPDTVVHPGAIEALAAFLAATPAAGVAAPRLLNPDGSVQPAAFRFPTLLMSLFDLFPPGEVLPGRLYHSRWHGRYPEEPTATTPFAIDHPLGACFMARRSAIDQVGLLDEQFFMYAEEVDWCYRVQRAGWEIWQVPAARVTHVGGAATRQLRARMLVALYEARLHFFSKHYPARFIRWHRWIVRVGMLRATLLAWRAYARGEFDAAELRARLWAYGKAAQL